MSDPVPTGSVKGRVCDCGNVCQRPGCALYGAGGICGRHGVYDGQQCPSCVTGQPMTPVPGMTEMPNPTPEQLASPEFEAIWSLIKSWDVNVPEFYAGYCGANGSHVALILNALTGSPLVSGEPVKLVPVDVAAVERATVGLVSYERTGTDLTPEARVACVIRALADVPGPGSVQGRAPEGWEDELNAAWGRVNRLRAENVRLRVELAIIRDEPYSCRTTPSQKARRALAGPPLVSGEPGQAKGSECR